MKTNLPICLHLDHGDTFELCRSCVDGGFTSVMIGRLHHPYEEIRGADQKGGGVRPLEGRRGGGELAAASPGSRTPSTFRKRIPPIPTGSGRGFCDQDRPSTPRHRHRDEPRRPINSGRGRSPSSGSTSWRRCKSAARLPHRSARRELVLPST